MDRCLACIMVAWLAAAAAAGASAADDRPPTGTAQLRLRNGDYVSGWPAESTDATTLKWSGPPFDRPLAFQSQSIAAIHFPATDLPPPRGSFGFELAAGDVLYGSVAGVNDDHWTIEAHGMGRVALQAAQIRRIFRWDDGRRMVYDGPRRLQEWQVAEPRDAWRFDGWSLATAVPLARLQSDLQLPAHARIDLQISWAQRPDFILALGVDPADAEPRGGLRLEVWDDDLVAVWEHRDRATVAPVATVSDGPSSMRLSILLDQTAGLALVRDEAGHAVARLHLPPPPHTGTRSGVLLQNIRGDVQLDSLRIVGGAPLTDADGPLLRLIDGSIVPGQVIGTDDHGRRLFISSGDDVKPSPVDVSQVDQIVTGSVADSVGQDGDLPDDAPRVRVAIPGGMCLRGALLRMDNDHVHLQCEAVAQSVTLETRALRSLVFDRVPPLDDAPAAAATATAGRARSSPADAGDAAVADALDAAGVPGQLELRGTRLRGHLISTPAAEAEENSGGAALVWLPAGSRTPAGLRAGTDGQIIFGPEDGTTAIDPAATTAKESAAGGSRVGQEAALRFSALGAFSSEQTHTLYLRSGDRLPGQVQQITDRGLAFQTDHGSTTWVPHTAVTAVELAVPYQSLALDADRRQRLLTVPRAQRDAPPTHLVASTQGDWLRGRRLTMDDHQITIETPFGAIQVPRRHVAAILWMNDPQSNTDGAANPSDPAAAPRIEGDWSVQAVRADGSRLTFVPTVVRAGVLAGVNAALGPCSIPLQGLDRLRLGRSVKVDEGLPAFADWTLRHAPAAAADAPRGNTPRIGKITTDGE